MYFPILRGRQFELLALRECVEKNILSEHITPIIEPVKVSSTFTSTVNSFIETGRSIAVIHNPQVGSWGKDLEKESNKKIGERINNLLVNSTVIPSFYVTSELAMNINSAMKNGAKIEDMLLIFNNPEYIENYEEIIEKGNHSRYNVIPDKGDFRRRIRRQRVICDDHFPKQTRNVDYLDVDTEFFSSDHLYYKDDGYVGFSDYSIVGEEYSETGFAPYAVAIHIVYFDEKNVLRIAHFVSDSNDDISDPARKFAEAVRKLIEWNKMKNLETVGIKAFEKAYNDKTYPGLGVVKKYSIMHHIELMGEYLDGVSK